MGTFNYTITAHSPDGSRSQPVSAFVDTGSLFTWLPAAVLEQLGVARTERVSFILANGETILRDTADVSVEIDGRRHVSRIVFGEPTDLVLLGALTLETFLLIPDVVNRRLVPVVGLAVTPFVLGQAPHA